jgi:cell division initiation protein
MSLTPAEIRHLDLKRTPFGYKRGSVDHAVDEIVDSFEHVWRERADLTDKVEQLENDMVRYRELETLLRTTLISAERAAHELKDQARKEAELIISEAHAEARSITREAAAQREHLLTESRRLESMLRSALAAIDHSTPEVVKPQTDAEAA